MSSAFLNGVTISRSASVSPLVFSAIPEVNSFDGLGKTNPLVDVTSFDSTAREYIAGLADGVEITMECNYLPGNTQQDLLAASVDSGVNFFLQVVVTDATVSPNVGDTFTFEVVPISWVVGPSYDDKNTRNFSFKITGDITTA